MKKKPKKRSKIVWGWHFLDSNRKLGYRDGRVVRARVWYSIPTGQVVVPCSAGMHAAPNVARAISYAKGLVMCRVQLRGDVVRHVSQARGVKHAARARLVTWSARIPTADIHKILSRALGFGTSIDWKSRVYLIRRNSQPRRRLTRELLRWARENGWNGR